MASSFFIRCLFYVVLLLTIFTGQDVVPHHWIYILYSVMILAITISETLILAKSKKSNFLLSPVVLCSIVSFVLPYSISNYLFFSSPAFLYNTQLYLSNDPILVLNEVLLYANVALLSMWIGYKLVFFSQHLYWFFIYTLGAGLVLRKQFLLHKKIILSIYLLTFLVRAYMIAIGGYGFASAYSSATIAVNYLEIINLSTSLFKLCLWALALLDYQQNNRLSTLTLTILGIELLLGLLSGYKSGLIYPLLLIGLAYIMTHRTVSRKLVIRFAVSIILLVNVGYFIIEPFRQVLVSGGATQNIDFGYLVDSFTESYETTSNTDLTSSQFSENQTESTFDSFMSRTNLTLWTAIALEKLNEADEYNKQARIKEKMLLIPLLAYIPRAFWPDKPERNEGSMFYKHILKMEGEGTAVTPGTIGYLLLAFGSPLIIIPIFALLGVLQHFIFILLQRGGGGVILFIGLLNGAVFIDEITYTFLPFFKEAPLLIILQSIILYEKKQFNFPNQ